MEPTDALFMIIVNIVLFIIFAIIPFLFGVFSNISTKFHKVFFIAGRIISVLLAISIAAGLSVGIVFVTENAFEVRPSYIYACYFCGLITTFIPLSTFYFTTCKKTKKQRACYLTLSFIAFFVILSGFEFLCNRTFGFVFQTERFELSINDFYSNHPEADKNSDINVFASLSVGIEWLTVNISVYKDSITLKTIESNYIGDGKSEIDSCYRNDLPPDLTQDIIEEITYYQQETDYSPFADACLHPHASIELANNKNATTIKLDLPDIDEYHPNAQRLVKKIKSLAKDSKINPTKGCSN
ncbi:hypothetical protein [Fibrobacter succinogenes]|uniref:Uncharacterized protein n=1 Tax=Fibrobacter succinogenes TaxID=833 RepID=A0A380RUC8_FIBSU|nr:hypothetical protein [Fibrobacter succinogenes]PWJ36652.1 hypothetical protein IE02_0123 [Fibrobacter succinogenes subsp. elongatus]SUQ18901.1 hypothetical protein SAMN05661053_0123 [Fibrobacter succinogenes]